MKRKTKKAVKKFGLYFGVFAVLLLIFLVFYFGVQQSYISIEGLSPETRTENWQGIPVKITSHFGTITNVVGRAFNPDKSRNDITLHNSYDINEKLSLNSWIKTVRYPCPSNYIEAELELPAGKLSGTCIASAKSTYPSNPAIASCTIKSGLSTLYKYEFSTLAYSPEQDQFELTFDEPTKITVILTSQVSQGITTTSEASSKLDLEFHPLEVEPELITVYRLEITRDACRQLEIFSADRIADDYDTLEECEVHMTIPPKLEPPFWDVYMGVIVFALAILIIFFIILWIKIR